MQRIGYLFLVVMLVFLVQCTTSFHPEAQTTGPQGPAGPAGPTGPAGPQGPAGVLAAYDLNGGVAASYIFSGPIVVSSSGVAGEGVISGTLTIGGNGTISSGGSFELGFVDESTGAQNRISCFGGTGGTYIIAQGAPVGSASIIFTSDVNNPMTNKLCPASVTVDNLIMRPALSGNMLYLSDGVGISLVATHQ